MAGAQYAPWALLPPWATAAALWLALATAAALWLALATAAALWLAWATAAALWLALAMAAAVWVPWATAAAVWVALAAVSVAAQRPGEPLWWSDERQSPSPPPSAFQPYSSLHAGTPLHLPSPVQPLVRRHWLQPQPRPALHDPLTQPQNARPLPPPPSPPVPFPARRLPLPSPVLSPVTCPPTFSSGATRGQPLQSWASDLSIRSILVASLVSWPRRGRGCPLPSSWMPRSCLAPPLPSSLDSKR